MCSSVFTPVCVDCQVGVFVSIVSTKIPFKGAGKEYIGDDIEEMVGAVKQAIQACALQVSIADCTPRPNHIQMWLVVGYVFFGLFVFIIFSLLFTYMRCR